MSARASKACSFSAHRGRARSCLRRSGSEPPRQPWEQAGGRTPVVVHVGSADTQVTVELAEHAAARGADAVAVVPPFYYSDHTEFEIIAHYRAVGEAAPLPLFIYENPRYAGISIKPDLAVRMKEAIPSIKGIKVAYGLGSMLDYVRLLPDVAVFTGNADLFGLAPFGLAGMINPPTSLPPSSASPCGTPWRAGTTSGPWCFRNRSTQPGALSETPFNGTGGAPWPRPIACGASPCSASPSGTPSPCPTRRGSSFAGSWRKPGRSHSRRRSADG